MEIGEVTKKAHNIVTVREGVSLLDDIADMWSVYLDKTISAYDVSAMMIMLKLARVKSTPRNEDHWIDIAGYADIGGASIYD